MKTKITLLLIAGLILTSCTKWHYGHGEDNDDPKDETIYNDTYVSEGGEANDGAKIIPSRNKLIVRLDPNLSQEKLKYWLKYLEIQDTIGCSCGDVTIKQWTVDTSKIDIEAARRRLQDDSSGEAGLEGEIGFDIQLDPIPDFRQLDEQVDPKEFTNPSETASVNIAVLDTGIDLSRDLTPFSGQYLFNSLAYSNCYPTSSGWNFVNNSPNITDGQGHGTYVTKIIRDILDNSVPQIDYRILPLKVFDDNGRGSYWNIVCAMAYIKNINKNDGNIHIINTSFGGKQTQEILQKQTVLKRLINELSDKSLVISSAGNKGENTDDSLDGHFLSSYDSENILAVGGYFNDTIAKKIILHPKSNYGVKSIDVALEFGNYSVVLNTLDPNSKDRAGLEGTSYSTAAMTGLAGELFIKASRPDVTVLKEGILNLAKSESGLNSSILDANAIIR
ncbi:S8 family serine peptidase [Zobellia laminariae]|uniref:S8 family serine peptidase n=1 Tax=Zobellia laminariae TaxID=248906 RepID=UPI0026F475BD|nr:S8 family serine peptidase [Zobellia laminariae]WKX77352.1 S8 family serine peptidase [Zobellia laminariae]